MEEDKGWYPSPPLRPLDHSNSPSDFSNSGGGIQFDHPMACTRPCRVEGGRRLPSSSAQRTLRPLYQALSPPPKLWGPLINTHRRPIALGQACGLLHPPYQNPSLRPLLPPSLAVRAKPTVVTLFPRYAAQSPSYRGPFGGSLCYA